MIIARNDEEKRSVIWRIVVVVSSLVIMGVAAYFIIQIFTENPLIGTWDYEAEDIVIVFEDEPVAKVIYSEEEGVDFIIPLRYQRDKYNKIIEFSIDSSEIEDVNEGAYSAEEIYEIMEEYGQYNTSYDYSVTGGLLVLSDREYGDTYSFSPQ